MRFGGLILSSALLLAGAAAATAQMHEGHVVIYLPQIMDGGAQNQKWQTAFCFLNPNPVPAHVKLYPTLPDGTPMQTDLGSGTGSSFAITIPPRGKRQFTSTGTPPNLTVGWAAAFSDVPVQASAAIGQALGPAARAEMFVEPVLPAAGFSAPADAFTYVSLANPVPDAGVSVTVSLRDAEGNDVESKTLTIPAAGSYLFSVAREFPQTPAGFAGTLLAVAANSGESFVASVFSRDRAGMLHTWKLSRLGPPADQWERTLLIFRQVVEAARPYVPDIDSVRLQINADRVINAYAQDGEIVNIYLALTELISDSSSELAFAVAHEMGHIYQQRTGRRDFIADNPEFDADIWGFLLSLKAGYDPYASAGTLAKLAMVTGRAGLATQFEDQSADDAHKSFNTRIENVYEAVSLVCSQADTRNACESIKGVLHPHFPDYAPLRVKPGRGIEKGRFRRSSSIISLDR